MGGDTNGVDKVSCEKCREGIMKELDGLWDKSDKQEDQITELRIISARQLVIQEQMNELLKKYETKLDKYEDKGASGDKIWKQSWFKIVVATACICFVIILGAAIGINALKEWSEIVK